MVPDGVDEHWDHEFLTGGFASPAEPMVPNFLPLTASRKARPSGVVSRTLQTRPSISAVRLLGTPRFSGWAPNPHGLVERQLQKLHAAGLDQHSPIQSRIPSVEPLLDVFEGVVGIREKVPRDFH